jgi:hypothetical protein
MADIGARTVQAIERQAGSQPFIGEKNKLETVNEYKVEMLCDVDVIKPVIKALISSHPYEVPAYSVLKLENI